MLVLLIFCTSSLQRNRNSKKHKYNFHRSSRNSDLDDTGNFQMIKFLLPGKKPNKIDYKERALKYLDSRMKYEAKKVIHKADQRYQAQVLKFALLKKLDLPLSLINSKYNRYDILSNIQSEE